MKKQNIHEILITTTSFDFSLTSFSRITPEYASFAKSELLESVIVKIFREQMPFLSPHQDVEAVKAHLWICKQINDVWRRGKTKFKKLLAIAEMLL